MTTKKLIIVESPVKARFIKKLLNSSNVTKTVLSAKFDTLSTYGHVKDLPQKTLGIKFDEKKQKFYLNFVTLKRKVLQKLKEKAPLYDEIYISTDPDREGEAIAYHVYSELKKSLPPQKVEKIYRLRLHSITETHVLREVQKKEKIDLNLVKAQFARRAIDRLIGYLFSKLASKRLKQKVSVGRVQTPALYFIVKRYDEIKNFTPEEVFRLVGSFFPVYVSGLGLTFTASTSPFSSLAEAKQKLKSFLNCNRYKVENVSISQKKLPPPPPFTTSKLQREAFKRYGFSPEKTMYLAQRLYEKGHCTYIRTDSSYVTEEGLELAENFIKNKFGSHYLNLRTYENFSQPLAQEAHECIRPTHFKIPENVTNDELRLLHLVQTHFLASQMKPAVVETAEVQIKGFKDDTVTFSTTGERVVFDGFLKVLKDYFRPHNQQIFYLTKDQELNGCVNLKKEKTQPPPPYSPDTLIEELEKYGIGRPSTYAHVVQTIKNRNYVKNSKNFVPTDLALKIVKLFHEPDKKFLIDPEFTKKVEAELDKIAKGEKKPEEVISKLLEKIEKACHYLPLKLKAFKKQKQLRKSL